MECAPAGACAAAPCGTHPSLEDLPEPLQDAIVRCFSLSELAAAAVVNRSWQGRAKVGGGPPAPSLPSDAGRQRHLVPGWTRNQ